MKQQLIISFLVAMSAFSWAQKNWSNILPVFEQTLETDSKKGFAIKKNASSVHLLTDGIWQSVAIDPGQEAIPQTMLDHVRWDE